MRNIFRDGRVNLMFMIPGCNNIVWINGTAILTTAPDVINPFSKNSKLPRVVIIVTSQEFIFSVPKQSSDPRFGMVSMKAEQCRLPVISTKR